MVVLVAKFLDLDAVALDKTPAHHRKHAPAFAHHCGHTLLLVRLHIQQVKVGRICPELAAQVAEHIRLQQDDG